MSDVSSPGFWESIYHEGRAAWNLGKATPVFCRLLAQNRFQPGRMIVLGAGHGYDAREFARHNFTVTAVDFADDAIRLMRELADPQAPLTILQADIFELPHTLDAVFDYVLDYMCFCAIDPQKRPAYADLVARLLKPGGNLIALAYPVGNFTGGPPYAVNADAMVFMFHKRGFVLVEREKPTDSIPQRCGYEELLILRKK